MLSNGALGVPWVQKGRVSFNLYSDYLLSYQIPSKCKVKQTVSDSHCLPPPPQCIMIYSMTTRCCSCKNKMWEMAHWSPRRREMCKLKAHTGSIVAPSVLHPKQINIPLLQIVSPSQSELLFPFWPWAEKWLRLSSKLTGSWIKRPDWLPGSACNTFVQTQRAGERVKTS